MADIPSESVCRQCGAELRPGMLRCRECGTARDGAAPSSAASGANADARPGQETHGKRTSRSADSPKSKPGVPAANQSSPSGQRSVSAPDIAEVDSATETESAADGGDVGSESVAEPPRTSAFARCFSFVGAAIRSRLVWTALGVAAAGYALWSRPRAAPPPPAEATRVLRTPDEAFNVVVFSRDGRRVAAGAASGRVFVAQDSSEELKPLPECGTAPILSLTPGSDGFLYAGAADGALFGWDKAFGGGGAKPQRQKGLPSGVTAVAVRPGRSGLALGTTGGDLLLLGGKTPRRVEAKQRGLRAVAYASGDVLVTGGETGTIVWRDAETGEPVGEPFSLTAEVGGLAFDRAGTMAAGDWNGRIVLFDAGSRTPSRTLNQPDAVSGIVFAGAQIVTASWDGRLRFWSRDSETPVRTIDAHRPLAGLAIDPSGERLATPTADGLILLWRAGP